MTEKTESELVNSHETNKDLCEFANVKSLRKANVSCEFANVNSLLKVDLSTFSGILIKTTLVDFPGRVATAFFLRGCNLRCPYCYNTELVLPEQYDDEGLVSLQDLLAHLEKRKNVLTGIVISGGEPLLNPATPEIIKFARSLGYKIKIDTNGTLPEKLYMLLNDENLRPDFVAMDIKTSPKRYAELLLPKKETAADKNVFPSDETAFQTAKAIEEKIVRSAKLVATLDWDAREWRTVLVPHLVAENDIYEMAEILPKDASWQFAQFRNENCVDQKYSEVVPYKDEEIARLVSIARKIIPGAELR